MGEIKHLATYQADWERCLAGIHSDKLELATEGWDAFKRQGFPTSRRGNELWKYTDIRAINETEFRWDLQTEMPDFEELTGVVPIIESWKNMVFVDERYAGTWGAEIEGRDPGSSERLAHESETVHGAIANVESDPFVALNAAFCSTPLKMLVADDEMAPFQVIWVSTGSEPDARANYPRCALSLGPDTSATFIETHVSLTDRPLLEVPVVEVHLGAGASLTHYRLQLSRRQTYHVATTRVRQAAGSTYNSVSFATGAAIGRHDIHTHMGEGAECKLHGLYITNGDEHQSNEVSATHSKPHGTSDQFYKGILSGKSQAVFSGKVVVERGAQKTDAQQKDLNLLLSHGAEIDTKPSLEIYADDVQCGHGATAGHVDEDTLFYLQSRGVDYGTAQAMLIRGFAQEILDEFDLPELNDFLTRRVDDLLPELQATSDTIGTA